MVRSVRILRIVLPILFVAFLALIVVSYSANSRRGQNVTEPVRSDIRQQDEPRLVATEFEDVQTIGGKIVSRIRARRTMGFESGWYTLEDVHLTMYRDGGDSYELSAPQAQFKAETKEAEAAGGVRVTSSDGVLIETETIHFDGSRLVNRVPVRFKADQWEGNAGSVDFNLTSERLRLGDGLRGTLRSTAPGSPPVAIRANEASFDRMAGEALFRGDVVVTRAADTMATETITARFDKERQELSALEGCCGVVMTIAPGSSLAPQAGSTVVRAERFFSDIGPGGEIRAVYAQGGGSAAVADLAGPPARRVEAQEFRVVFGDRGVSQLEASGNAVITETGPTPRTVRAAKMITWFDPVNGKPASAQLEGNLQYSDARNKATAQKATFDFVADRVLLLSVPGALPAVTTDAQSLTAQQIEANPKSGIVRANGSVKARFVSGRGSSTFGGSGIFPESESPVFVNSDSLVLQQKEQLALFSGQVRAWQDDNILLANEMRVEQAGGSLTASGNVRAVLYNAGQRESRSPVKASASTLTARRGEKTARLQDEVRIDDQGRTLSASSAEFLFGADDQLERVEATGSVEVSEKAAGRKGTGERLLYRVPQKMIHLEGSPATVSDPQGTVKGSEIVFDLARDRVEVLRGEGRTEATYRPKG